MENGRDSKKLIGTIIGVIAFIALIAGATYAWFTSTANVTNGTYNGTACSYNLTVTGGSINTTLPLASSSSSSSYYFATTHPETSASQGTYSAVTAKIANSCSASSAGKGVIKVKMTAGPSTNCPLSYAIYSGSVTTKDAVSSATAVASGTITTTGSYVSLYTTSSKLTTTAVTYTIWFYLDGDKISNDACKSLTYTGTVSISSTTS